LEHSTAVILLDYSEDLKVVTERSMKSQVAVVDRLILLLQMAGKVTTKKICHDFLIVMNIAF